MPIGNGSGACQPLTFQTSATVESGPGQTVDVEGAASAASYSNGRYLGNVYEAAQSTSLQKVEAILNFTGTRELNFVVYEAMAEGGPYTSLVSEVVQATGVGQGFYSSAPMSVRLESGRFYIVGVGWTGGNVTYYWNTAAMPHAVSFGQKRYGFRRDGYPMGSPVTAPDFYVANYYQRLTTEDSWLRASPASGSVAPGGQQDVVVSVSAAGLGEGIYLGSVRLATNIRGRAPDTVRVAMVVGTPANSAVCNATADSVAVSLRPGGVETKEVLISNGGGTGSVLIYGVTVQGNSPVAAPDGVRSIGGSTLTCAENTFQAGTSATLHFTVTNNSTDDEWLKDVSLDFPPGVTVNSATNFTGGSVGPIVWNGATGNGAIVAWHGDSGPPDYYGVVRMGESATATVNVTYAPVLGGPLSIAYVITGDQWGGTPHSVAGTVQLQSGPASIAVTAPNGGERLAIGSAETITWTSAGSLPAVRVDLSRNAGVSWQSLTGSTSNTGQYPWTVSGPGASQCRIRVSSPDLTVSDQSNGAFAIYQPVSWVQASPATGILEQGQSQALLLSFNTSGLAEGNYNAWVVIDHNGASSPTVLPISMMVNHLVDVQESVPKTLWLAANYPNPFRQTTTVRFGLPSARPVTLRVYDLQGRMVRTLLKGNLLAGEHKAVWNGLDERGRMVASGTYFCSLHAGAEVRISKMMRLR